MSDEDFTYIKASTQQRDDAYEQLNSGSYPELAWFLMADAIRYALLAIADRLPQ